MNRQIRRDQERKQEKQDKEKEKRRNERRKRREQAKAARARRKESARQRGAEDGGQERPAGRSRGRAPGRFSGALAGATVFFILLQGIVPTEEMTVLNTAVSAGFYLLFGYFATLWLLRRGSSRAVAMTVAAGAMLGLGVEVGKVLRPELPFDPFLAAAILPALAIGALLGRLVYFNAPA